VSRRVLIWVGLAVLALVAASFVWAQDAGVRYPSSGLAAGDTVYAFPANQPRLINFNDLPVFEATITGTGTDTIGFYNRVEGFSVGGAAAANFTYDANVGWVVTVVDNAGSGLIVNAWPY